MRSTNSYSNNMISGCLVREAMTRFWMIPALSLLFYFLVGLLPLLLNYRSFETVAMYGTSVMEGGTSVQIIVLIAAVVSSAAVFNYLHDPVSANVLHAMPVKRAGHFGSAALSGWIFLLLPILVFAFLLLVMRGATYSPGAEAMVEDSLLMEVGQLLPATEIFTLPHAFLFILRCGVTATFAYAVSCLAAVLSGRRIIHVLLAFFLLALPATLIFQVNSICESYLFGFPGFDVDYSLLSPLFVALYKGWTGGLLAWYLILSLVLLAAAYMLYRKVRIERIGSATTFPVVGDILCILITFIAAMGVAEILGASVSSDMPSVGKFLVTALIASLVFYLITRMIADSTPAVFHGKTAAKFGLYLIILCLFLAFAVIDVTHYGQKIPAEGDIDSVHVETNFPQGMFDIDKDFDDPETCGAVRDLQEAILAERGHDHEDADTEYLTLTWTLKDGNKISRDYLVHLGKGFEKTEAAFGKLYETPAFAKARHLDRKKLMADLDYMNVYVYNADGEAEETRAVAKKDRQALLEAIDRDLNGRSFEEMRMYPTYEGKTVNVDVGLKNRSLDDVSEWEYILMPAVDKNAIGYLEEKGYM